MIELAPRQSIQIPDPSTIAIRCIAGCLWITQEGDPDDHILQTGETIQFQRKGLVITSALRPSVLQMTELHKNGNLDRQTILALDPDGSYGTPVPVGVLP